MVTQVASAKAASAASKAMVPLILRGRSASALQVTQVERKLAQLSTLNHSMSENTPTEAFQQAATVKLQSQSKQTYHQQSMANYETPAEAVDIDAYLDHLLELKGFWNGSCDRSHDRRKSPLESEEAVALDSRAIANMLMLRKELLLLHKLLDNLR
jgi:hypothetical protein